MTRPPPPSPRAPIATQTFRMPPPPGINAPTCGFAARRDGNAPYSSLPEQGHNRPCERGGFDHLHQVPFAAVGVQATRRLDSWRSRGPQPTAWSLLRSTIPPRNMTRPRQQPDAPISPGPQELAQPLPKTARRSTPHRFRSQRCPRHARESRQTARPGSPRDQSQTSPIQLPRSAPPCHGA
jgi:hypothetical protein